MEFEWHEEKAKSNFNKHKVLFEEAMSCFYDPYQISFEDPDENLDEFREILIGHSNKGRLLLVVYTLRDNTIRIISTRLTTKREMQAYAKRI
jgi:uncharacterized DUF497 family protein